MPTGGDEATTGGDEATTGGDEATTGGDDATTGDELTTGDGLDVGGAPEAGGAADGEGAAGEAAVFAGAADAGVDMVGRKEEGKRKKGNLGRKERRKENDKVRKGVKRGRNDSAAQSYGGPSGGKGERERPRKDVGLRPSKVDESMGGCTQPHFHV